MPLLDQHADAAEGRLAAHDLVRRTATTIMVASPLLLGVVAVLVNGAVAGLTLLLLRLLGPAACSDLSDAECRAAGEGVWRLVDRMLAITALGGLLLAAGMLLTVLPHRAARRRGLAVTAGGIALELAGIAVLMLPVVLWVQSMSQTVP